MKISTSLAFLMACTAATAQTKTVEIPLENPVTDYRFPEQGGVYLQFGKARPSPMAASSNKKAFVYDQGLDLKQDYDLTAITFGLDAIILPDGKLAGFYKIVSRDAAGHEGLYLTAKDKEYNSISGKDSQGPLKEVFTKINTDKYQVDFGMKIRRNASNALAGSDASDVYLYRTEIATRQSKLIKIEFPVDQFMLGLKSFQYHSHDNEKVFFLLNKIAEDGSCAATLASFDYDGRLIDNIPFNITLANNQRMMPMNRSRHYVYTVTKGGINRQAAVDASVINSKFDATHSKFYVYGIFGADANDMNSATGYYIYAYDLQGHLLWKKEAVLAGTDKKKGSFAARDWFALHNLPGGKIAFWCQKFHDDPTFFYIINGQTGQIEKEKMNQLSGVDQDNFHKGSNVIGMANSSVFIGKDDKTLVDMPAAFAYSMLPDAEKQINGRSGSKFAAGITPKGLYIIEENEKEKKCMLRRFEL